MPSCHDASGASLSSSDVFRSQGEIYYQSLKKGVHFSSVVEVHGVPFEDRSGFVRARPSASPASPAQHGINGDGVEMLAELLIGFCARVAERRRAAALRRAEREEEREMMKGLGGKIRAIERPIVSSVPPAKCKTLPRQI